MKKIFGLFFMLSFVTSAIGINVVEVTTSKEVGLSKLLTKEEALMLDSIKVDGYVSIEDIAFLNLRIVRVVHLIDLHCGSRGISPLTPLPQH